MLSFIAFQPGCFLGGSGNVFKVPFGLPGRLEIFFQRAFGVMSLKILKSLKSAGDFDVLNFFGSGGWRHGRPVDGGLPTKDCVQYLQWMQASVEIIVLYVSWLRCKYGKAFCNA